MKKLRQSTVEPVFGTLINYMGMSKISSRGIEQANKVMIMAGAAYNLQKLMRYMNKNRKIDAMSIRNLASQTIFNIYNTFSRFFELFKETYIRLSGFEFEIVRPEYNFILNVKKESYRN